MILRRATNFVACSALVATCATLVSWAFSYRTYQFATLYHPNGRLQEVAAGLGQVEFKSSSIPRDRAPARTILLFRKDAGTTPGVSPGTFWRNRGFYYDRVPPTDPRGPHWRVVVPHWFVILLLAPWPLCHFYLAFRRPRRWAKLGLCTRCGYDLRGNPAAGRCPECGTPTPSPAPAPPATT